jgi:hypothetical protein
MKISIHPLIKGKPAKGSQLLMELGDGWINIDESYEDIFALITEDGYATSAELIDDHKMESNFVSRQLIFIDIDDGMTLPELFQDEIYNMYGAGFYATPSYTDEHPKFRILFRAESPITNSEDYRRLNETLLRIYKSADPACKDACRLFYGTPNCELKEMTDNILPDSVILEMISLTPIQVPLEKYIPEAGYLSDTRKATIINCLCSFPIENYIQWRTIGWGLRHGGFDEEDFQIVTRCSKQDRTPKEASVIWKKADKYGKITMGSVIYIIKQNCGEKWWIYDKF